MPTHDDDDFFQGFEESRRPRGGGKGGDSWDLDDPDVRDLAPDDFATIRCTHCRKLILEDSIRCPYCKEWQTGAKRNRKPLWFVITAIVCILVIGGYAILALLGHLPWMVWR